MKTKLINIWYRIRSSFWFLPTVMIGATIALSFLTVWLDRTYDESLSRWWVHSNDPDGAREILSTIAGSMITVAGVVFSITIVVLSLASSQFGPRLIWNFMHDLGNQFVLGTFISTFIYCLLLLRTLGNSSQKTGFVPDLSVTFGILLAMASLGVLIYFIHHISSSIHANSVVAGVYRDLDRSIERFFPEKLEPHETELKELRGGPGIPEEFEGEAFPVLSVCSGYLEAIDMAGLMEIATRKDLLFHLKYRPGHFIMRKSKIVMVWPAEKVDESLVAEVNNALILGTQRTIEQDVEFAVHQLVEIAVRALSPSVNDPFTAISCLDWLGAALRKVAQRRFPSPCHYDEEGQLRIISTLHTFSGIADAAFNQIRQYGRSVPSVVIRMLETIAAVAEHIQREEDRAVLMRHALMVRRAIQQNLPEEFDLRDVEDRFQKAVKALNRAVPDSHNLIK